MHRHQDASDVARGGLSWAKESETLGILKEGVIQVSTLDIPAWKQNWVTVSMSSKWF